MTPTTLRNRKKYSEAAMEVPDDTIGTDDIHIEIDGSSSDTCGDEDEEETPVVTPLLRTVLAVIARNVCYIRLHGILIADPFDNMKLLITGI